MVWNMVGSVVRIETQVDGEPVATHDDSEAVNQANQTPTIECPQSSDHVTLIVGDDSVDGDDGFLLRKCGVTDCKTDQSLPVGKLKGDYAVVDDFGRNVQPKADQVWGTGDALAFTRHDVCNGLNCRLDDLDASLFHQVEQIITVQFAEERNVREFDHPSSEVDGSGHGGLLSLLRHCAYPELSQNAETFVNVQGTDKSLTSLNFLSNK